MKHRYRQHIIKKWHSPDKVVLILQVYVSWPDSDYDMHGMPNSLAGSGWRDAKVEDLTETETESKETPWHK